MSVRVQHYSHQTQNSVPVNFCSGNEKTLLLLLLLAPCFRKCDLKHAVLEICTFVMSQRALLPLPRLVTTARTRGLFHLGATLFLFPFQTCFTVRRGDSLGIFNRLAVNRGLISSHSILCGGCFLWLLFVGGSPSD